MSNACPLWVPRGMSAPVSSFPNTRGIRSQNVHVKRAGPNSADENALWAAHECLALSRRTSLQRSCKKTRSLIESCCQCGNAIWKSLQPNHIQNCGKNCQANTLCRLGDEIGWDNGFEIRAAWIMFVLAGDVRKLQLSKSVDKAVIFFLTSTNRFPGHCSSSNLGR